MSKKPSIPTVLLNDVASLKTVFLRVSPDLHAALMSAAGAEQQRSGRRVSVNWYATKLLADALGFEVEG